MTLFASPASPPAQPTVVRYQPLGAARAVMACRDREVLISGPAGTGKTYGALHKLHLAALKYPGMRGLIVRKTLVALTASALVTFAKLLDAAPYGVIPFGGSKLKPTAFRYPNGSEIVIGGMDKAAKVMSAEYDLIYVNEAIELTEADWEALTTRLRHGRMPYQQLLADCNPDAPTHWLNQRCLAGKTTRFASHHQDNPALFNPATQVWTERGCSYLRTLEALSGVRRARLLSGQWVAAEGQVYDAWRREVHVVAREQLAGLGFAGATRYVAGVDWGWTNPGVITVWAVGPDGQMALVHEVYQTRRPQDWWVAKAQELAGRYDIETFLCDPAEPAYLDAFRRAGLDAVGAEHAILPGITAVQGRLAVGGDGRARLYVAEDALEAVDQTRRTAALPASGIEEIDAYVWAQGAAGRKERPVDEHNHALDTWRYVALHLEAPLPTMQFLDGETLAALRRWTDDE